MIYGDADKNQKPGLFYGLTVDGTQTLYYTYDGLENITHIHEKNSDSAAKTEKVRYTYDELSQLVREDNRWLDKTIVYTYDAGGNLTSKEEYAYTTGSVGTAENSKSYAYRTTGWKDQLTAYDGQSITYDTMGNPLSYRGMQMTWQKGRELKGVEKDGTSVTYAYNQEGVRIRKTVGDTETRYYLNGDKIVAMEDGNGTIHFLYDQKGHLLAMKVGNDYYYYLRNNQNDIVGLIDSTGTQVVSYQYDSWGKPIAMTDLTVDEIGSRNPFRYKEYCWEEETALYYVSSRYYDSNTGRFISADDIGLVTESPKALTDKNLYAYCDNNPVTRMDKGGKFWDTVLDIAFIAGDLVSILENPTDVVGYAELAADVVGLALPGVTGGGTIVRTVMNSDNVLDAAKLADKVVDSTKAIKSSKSLGTKLHKMYDPIKKAVGKGDRLINQPLKEVKSKLRPDAVDKVNRIIYELKPYNKRSYKRALKQTKRYATLLGGKWKIVIDMYRR